jgi:hypothetical protein
MIIEKIKHDCWVYKKIDGIEYRGKYIDSGYSYAKFHIQKQSFIKKETWFGFGKNKQIPVWGDMIKVEWRVIDLKEYYEVEDTEKIFNSFVNKPNIVHKERLESKAEKRERIINKIIK